MQEISFETVLEDFFNYKISSLYTALPCRVVTVRSTLNDQRVDVQPLTNRILPDETSREQPTILNVQVMFPSSKKASLTFPVDVGDVVLCVFTQRSIDSFKASTGAKTYVPDDRRKFDIKDAVAIPGLFPFEDAINNPDKRKWTHSTRDVVLVNNIGSSTECEFRLKDNGNIEVRTDQDFYGKFNDGLIECNNLTIECANNFTVNAGQAINLSSTSTTMNSSANTDITAGTDLNVTAATWNVTVASAATVNAPTTNWTGAFNLMGPLTLAGALAMSGGGGGGTATIDAPLTVNSPITVNSGLSVVGGDVTADGISLKTHVHPNPEGGTTGPAQ